MLEDIGESFANVLLHNNDQDMEVCAKFFLKSKNEIVTVIGNSLTLRMGT